VQRVSVMEMSYGPSGRGLLGGLGENSPEVVRDVIVRRPGDQHKKDVEQ
jgi:hypothetical protein